MQNFELTSDQQRALKALLNFVEDDKQNEIVLNGFAGTGKSFLIQHFVNQLQKKEKLKRKLDKDYVGKQVILTATTNKAVGVLNSMFKNDAVYISTIHSFLGLIPDNKGKLKRRTGSINSYSSNDNAILIIDECSMISKDLMSYLKTYKIKKIFIGDSLQLPPIRESISSSFSYPTVTLNHVVRQPEGALENTVTALRNILLGKGNTTLDIDGKSVIRYNNKEDFKKAILDTFNKDPDSKILCYKNADAIKWDEFVLINFTGREKYIEAGDIMVSNYYIPQTNTKNNATVVVEEVFHDVLTAINHPEKNIITTRVRFNNSVHILHTPLTRKYKEFLYLPLADLRHSYASTVHKAQGSTYRNVFIDLTQFKAPINILYKLLYVAASRASVSLHLYGDIV